MFATTQSFRMILAIGCTALALALASSGAFARSPDDGVRSKVVNFSELDVSRAAGAQVLYGRIHRAAVEVCSDSIGPFSEVRTKAESCYQNAVANAVAQVNSPQLFEVYRAHLPRLASN